MYHYLVKTQMWTKSGSFLTSAALLVMCGDHDIEVANQSDVGQFKKDIRNVLGCEIVPEANRPKTEDSLSGRFRYGTTILITDVQFTVATASGSHNFVMGLQDMGWDNVVVFKIQDAEGRSGIHKFMNTVDAAEEYITANPQLVNLTIHVWLSMSFVMNPNPPHILLAEANFHIMVRASIQELEEMCARPVFVAVCPDSRFNKVEGRTDEMAKRLTAELRDWGILVSTSENMWRMMFSQFGHQYKILRKAPEGSAGKNAIWAAIEKSLFRQRVFLMCASDREAAVDRLNQVAHQPKHSGISLHRLRIITSPPSLFHTSEEKHDSMNREEEYWRSVGEEGEIGVTATRFTKKARKQMKPKWLDIETANLDLDQRPATSAFWLPVDLSKESDILCRRCRLATSFAELEGVEDDARYCINCSANNQSQYKRTGPELGESQAVMILAARLKTALRVSGADRQDPRVGFKDWLINVAASFVANHGAIPAPQDGILAYRLMKDCGNVLYEDFLKKIIDDDSKMNEIFGPTTATAEKAGDVVEFWLGLLDVAAMTRGTVNVFPDDLDPSPFLNGLEDAVRFFRQTARSTSTINDKRKGSFDCTLDAREMEEVTQITREIRNFKDPKDFHYLTDEELADLLHRYELRMEHEQVDYEEIVPDQEPEEEKEDVDMPEKEKEEPKHDEAMRDEVNDARGKLVDALGQIYNVSEDVQVCLYCGSIEHDHESCQHENKSIIKNAFQLIRTAMFPETTTAKEDEGEADDEAATAEVPPEGDDAPTEKGFDDDEEEEVESPPEHMYERPLFMSQVGDKDEYGSFCIDGFLLAQGGPTTVDEIKDIAKEAMMKGRGDKWTWSDFWNSYPEYNRDVKMYQRVDLPDDCWADNTFLQILPTTGCYFHNCDYYDGVSFAPKYDPWLDEYEYQLSFDINSVLRHQVGRTSGHRDGVGLKCDDSGWVRLEDFLAYETVWRIHRLRRDHIPFRTWDHHNKRWVINYEEGRNRLKILMRIMHSCVVRGNRVRIQMLGLGVDADVKLDVPYCVRKGITSDVRIPPEGLIVEPIAVRAPSGHSRSGFGEVQLKEELLSHPMTPGFVAAMPECYHETDRDLLMQIWEGGLQPGAGAEQGRICTFFNPFPPWDNRSWKIVKGTAKHKTEPTEVIMQEFEGRVTASGQPVTTMTTPFGKIRGAWVEDARKNWHRLLVPSGPCQLIKSVRSPGRYATRDTIIREARLCATAVGDEDSEAAEIIDIVTGLENKTIRSGTEEERTNMQKLLTHVLDHKEAERAGCTVCPACLLSTPVKLSMCLHCKGMMVSHGRKPFKMTKEEVEEAQSTPMETEGGGDEVKEDDEAEEVKMETDDADASNQFEEVHRDLEGFSFNIDEVDYDEDEEEGMEVEEENDESKLRPMDDTEGDDRVTGDDDDRLRELAEERVRAQQERDSQYPKWAQPLKIGTKKMPQAHEAVNNIDPDEVSPQILDNTLMLFITGYYEACYLYRTEMPPETRYEWTMNQDDRLDLDKLAPMNGYDENGELRPPTMSTLRPWFDKRARPDSNHDNEMLWEGRPLESMMLMIETAIKIEKIMAFLVETGLSPQDIKFYLPSKEDKADQSRRARMRRIISNFLARAIKGAFPHVTTYTYFRDEDDVWDYGGTCLCLPAVGVYYTVRNRYRNLEVAIIAAQCGVRLPRILQNQVEHAWAKAVAEEKRGKKKRMECIMPSAPERRQDISAIVDESSASSVRGTQVNQPGSQASSSSKGSVKAKGKEKDKGKYKSTHPPPPWEQTWSSTTAAAKTQGTQGAGAAQGAAKAECGEESEEVQTKRKKKT
eukprot:s370_g17.t1